MASQRAIDVNRITVVNHLNKCSARVNDLAEQVDPLFDTIVDTAEHFEKARNADEVQASRAVLKELLVLEADLKAHSVALKQLAAGYRPTINSNTDFKALLEERSAAIPPECAPEEDGRLQDAEGRIWKVHHPDEPMPGRAASGGADEDDDIVLEGAGASSELSKNPRCPITGLEVLELREPVEDERGFVYEKAAIEGWLASRGHSDNPVDAPFAATGHKITKAGLKKATKVLREQRRRQRRPNAQTQEQRAEDDTVVDV